METGISVDVIIPWAPSFGTRDGSLSIVLGAFFSHDLLCTANYFVVPNGDLIEENRREIEYVSSTWPSVHVMYQSKPSRSHARNHGAYFGYGDYLLLCDADIVPEHTLLDEVISRSAETMFLCGALKRHIPFSTPLSEVAQLVHDQCWEDLDRLATAQPAPNSGAPYAQEYQHGTLHRTFLTAFGLVPRATFKSVGGLSDSYDSWGLEDTDLMRRLFAKVDYGELQSGRTWHLDHLVEPYRHAEHWQVNWKKYTDTCAKHGFLIVDHFFGSGSRGCADSSVFLAPTMKQSRSNVSTPRLNVSKDWHDSLHHYVSSVLKDKDTCSIILHGSARSSSHPRDLDVSRLVFSRDIHRITLLEINSVPIEEESRSILDMLELFARPGKHPDVWPWLLSRYDHRWVIGGLVDASTFLSELRDEAIAVNGHHLLTYHAGNLIKGIRAAEKADNDSILRHAAVLLGLSDLEFPDRWKYPFFTNDSLIDAMDHTRKRLLHGTKSEEEAASLVKSAWNALEERIDDSRTYFPASRTGLDFAKEVGVSLPQPLGHPSS